MPPKISVGTSAAVRQKQSLKLGAAQLHGIRLLAKSLPELRAEIMSEMSENPAIEDMTNALETPLSEVERERESSEEPDYLDDDFVPGLSRDDEAAERRQAFFDSQVKTETLQSHLLSQLPFSEIPREHWPMATMLVGDLDDNGYYRGSVPDVMMAFGCGEDAVAKTLARIMALDPLGCGARTPRECLLAQMETLKGAKYEREVRAIIDGHLDDIGNGRYAVVMKALGLTRDEYDAAVKALRTLNPHPGRAFPGEHEREEYVNPEIHVERNENGVWTAFTDERSLPEIRISKKFMRMLEDPDQTEEVKNYVRERIAAAENLRDAVRRRQQTVSVIAQTIVDRQRDFFTRGLAGLKPLTESEVAKIAKVDVSTVSRTVRDKYAKTPKGTMELRRFFVTGVVNSDGETVSQDAALDALKRIVASEDVRSPLSDGAIAERMKDAGFPLARRTIAKYRERLGILSAAERKAK